MVRHFTLCITIQIYVNKIQSMKLKVMSHRIELDFIRAEVEITSLSKGIISFILNRF